MRAFFCGTSPWSATRLAAAREWSLWEGSVATLLPNAALMDDFAEPAKAVPFARICAKFFLDDFYLEESQLLKNVEKLAGIPGIIVQGRHDICCPPTSAWALKKAWPEAELWIIHDAGHAASEPGIIDGLVRAVEGQRPLDDAPAQRLGGLDLLGLVRVGEDHHMEVAVAHVADDPIGNTRSLGFGHRLVDALGEA